MFVKFKFARDKLNNVVYRYRNILYLEDNENDRKLTLVPKLFTK